MASDQYAMPPPKRPFLLPPNVNSSAYFNGQQLTTPTTPYQPTPQIFLQTYQQQQQPYQAIVGIQHGYLPAGPSSGPSGILPAGYLQQQQGPTVSNQGPSNAMQLIPQGSYFELPAAPTPEIIRPPSPTLIKPPSPNKSSHAKPRVNRLNEHLTCALCLGLFDNPKNMPNCAHVFCQACLQSLPTSFYGNVQVIECPQCRALSALGQGVESFQSNLVVRGVVEHIQAEEKAKSDADKNDDANECPHIDKTDGESITCPHCQQQFCNVCHVVHMEKLKVEATSASKQVIKTCEEISSAENSISYFESNLNATLKSVEAQVDSVVETAHAAFENSITVRAAALKLRCRILKDALVAQDREMLKRLTNGCNIQTLKILSKQILLSSVLSLKPSQLVDFHTAIKARQKAIGVIEALKEDSKALFSFEANVELQQILEALFNADIGTVKIANEELLDQQTLESLNLPPPMEIVEMPATSASSAKSVQHIHQLSNAKSVTTWPSRNLFVILHGTDKIAFVDRTGKVAQNYTAKQICIGPEMLKIRPNLQVAIVSDDGRHLSYTAKVNSASTTAIKGCLGQLLLEADSGGFPAPTQGYLHPSYLDGGYQGMAVVDEWDTVFAAEGAHLHAYTSPKTSRTAYTVALFEQVSTFLHGVVSVVENSCQLLCSSAEGQVVLVSVTRLPEMKNKLVIRKASDNSCLIPQAINLRNGLSFLLPRSGIFFLLEGRSIQAYQLKSSDGPDNNLGAINFKLPPGNFQGFAVIPDNPASIASSPTMSVALIDSSGTASIVTFASHVVAH